MELFSIRIQRTFQLVSTVLDNPEAIQRIKEPTEKNADCRRTEKAGTCPAVHQPNGESTAFRRNCLS